MHAGYQKLDGVRFGGDGVRIDDRQNRYARRPEAEISSRRRHKKFGAVSSAGKGLARCGNARLQDKIIGIVEPQIIEAARARFEVRVGAFHSCFNSRQYAVQ